MTGKIIHPKNRKSLLFLLIGLLISGLFLLVWGVWNIFNPVIDLTWEATNDVNTIGYNIYRSLNQNGPYKKLNEQVILAQAGDFGMHTYRYRDTPTEDQSLYYYRIEQLSLNSNGAISKVMVVPVTSNPGWELWSGVVMVIVALYIMLKVRN